MKRPSHTIVVTALIALLCPLSALAEKPEKIDIAGSNFALLHYPVNPEEPDDYCLDPLGNPAALFNVSGLFGGVLVATDNQLPFWGTGDAAVCVYSDAIDGVLATFTGSFTWHTFAGRITGTFEGVEYPTDTYGVFATEIFIEFNRGTRAFAGARGDAVAEGLDFPSGGLGGDPSAAGVTATIVEGELKLKE